MGEDKVFEQLKRAVDALEVRGGDLVGIRDEQARQAQEQERQASTLDDIKSTLDEMKGADLRGQVSSLRSQVAKLHRALLEPEGVVDKLRLENAKRTGRAMTWATIAAILGAIGTVLGILKQAAP